MDCNVPTVFRLRGFKRTSSLILTSFIILCLIPHEVQCLSLSSAEKEFLLRNLTDHPDQKDIPIIADPTDASAQRQIDRITKK